MHPLINEEMLEYIRTTGQAFEARPNRVEIMASLNMIQESNFAGLDSGTGLQQ
jgi:hypothetical protein